jgi:hypothetical protein
LDQLSIPLLDAKIRRKNLSETIVDFLVAGAFSYDFFNGVWVDTEM